MDDSIVSDSHSTANAFDTHSNDNLEYDQIKYNFLKLLKQFKIFEFDKFMKWLENLIGDYHKIGYNVIGETESILLLCAFI